MSKFDVFATLALLMMLWQVIASFADDEPGAACGWTIASLLLGLLAWGHL